jgi:hypothetical protein
MAAMDTLMPGIRTGNFAPCRAGGFAGNHLTHSSFIPAKSASSSRMTVTLATRSREVPAALRMAITMMLSLYVALGVFLLIAVRNPSAHRSVIAFAAWSTFAHAVAMSTLGLEIASQRVGFLVGSAVLVVIGVVIALAPAKSVARVSGGRRVAPSQSEKTLTPTSHPEASQDGVREGAMTSLLHD